MSKMKAPGHSKNQKHQQSKTEKKKKTKPPAKKQIPNHKVQNPLPEVILSFQNDNSKREKWRSLPCVVPILLFHHGTQSFVIDLKKVELDVGFTLSIAFVKIVKRALIWCVC